MWSEAPHEMSHDVTPGVVYQTFGHVHSSTRAKAERLMERLSRLAPRPVIFAKVKVTNDEERDLDQRLLVQATLDVSGVVLRAQSAGPHSTEALALVGRRLERRLNRLAERREQALRRPTSTSPGRWRNGDPATDRPRFIERLPEQRMVVRRKTYSPTNQISVGEALFDLEILDYRFFLFTDEADHKTSIVYETPGGHLAIRKTDGSSPDPRTLRPGLEINKSPASQIRVADAVSRMNATKMAFIFFCDVDRGRASVLYRRYDGHYGLVVPSTPYT